MLKRFRKTLATAAVVLGIAMVPLAFAGSVSAQQQPPAQDNPIQNNLKCGTNLSLSQQDANCEVSGGTDKVNNLITQIVNIFSIIVGIVSVIMIIYGGFRYVTSGGDSSNVSNAKNTIIYAIIGLVVVALAQFIVQFVLDKVTASE